MIAAEYTREAGVRQLERGLAKVLRKVTVALDSATAAPVHVDADTLVKFLGRPRFTPESAERTAVPGVATGLAVTGAGGDVLFIEATAMDGDLGLILTGQLQHLATSATRCTAQLATHRRGHVVQVGLVALRDEHVVMPARCAASSFCLTPPIGSTRPVSDTSPVIADVARTGRPTAATRAPSSS